MITVERNGRTFAYEIYQQPHGRCWGTIHEIINDIHHILHDTGIGWQHEIEKEINDKIEELSNAHQD